MRAFLLQKKNTQYPGNTIDTINSKNNNNNNMKATNNNELWWSRRKTNTFIITTTTTTLKRERTHTEETVAESQDVEDVTLEPAINITSPRGKGNSKKSVSFSTTVSIYHHPLILGDHPAVRNGVPLMLDWTAVYTEQRSLRDNKKQSSTTLVPALSLYVREVLAQQAGATKNELRAAREQVRAIQLSRQQSMACRGWWPWPR